MQTKNSKVIKASCKTKRCEMECATFPNLKFIDYIAVALKSIKLRRLT